MPHGFRMSTEEFIIRAKEIHGDKYDYSKVEYINTYTPVCIICPIHGEFWQTPKSHLSGHGCIDCTGKRKKTTEQFIAEARKVHGDKYDYSKTNYIDSHTKVCIICPIHGEFWQSPALHLRGQGCRKCAEEIKAINRCLTFETFVERSTKVHGGRYKYLPTKLKGVRSLVSIICPIHGVFEQTPEAHMNGSGCPKCASKIIGDKNRYDNEIFIKKAREAHWDRFGYELVDYKGCYDPVKIICPKHGIFEQTPASHWDGAGCPHCKESKGEKEVTDWLTKNNIEYQREYKVIPPQVLFGRNRFEIDFYLPGHNTFIEFHGEQHYSFVPIFHKTEDKFAEQQDRDRRLREYCKRHGITLIEIPYTEIDNIDKILTKRIKL